MADHQSKSSAYGKKQPHASNGEIDISCGVCLYNDVLEVLAVPREKKAECSSYRVKVGGTMCSNDVSTSFPFFSQQ